MLAAQAARAGAVLTWLGTQVLPAFQHPADPAQARQYLTELSACLVRANSSLPSQIGGLTAHPAHHASPLSLTRHSSIFSHSSLISGGNSVSNTGAVTQAGPSPDTDGHGLPSRGGSGGGPAAAGNVPLAAGPRPTASPVSSLQSAAPVPGAPAVTSAAPAPAAPAVPTAASLATGAGPVPEVPGADGPALSTHPLPELPGLDTTGLHGADLDSGLSGGDLAGLPVTGGVSAQPRRARRRQAWATEDRNIWSLPAGCVPPVIEGSWRAPSR